MVIDNPLLYEINSYTFLTRMSDKYGPGLTLSGIPDSEWQDIADRGFNLIWMMGVWQRSPLARSIALRDAGLKKSYKSIIPAWEEKDIAGSPYAVHDYSPDKYFGGKDDLLALKNRLNSKNIGLILDFVPNHLAADHPWTDKYPDRFVKGTKKVLNTHPEWFFQNAGETPLAHGRDPYFAPWTDTAQVNFFSPALRNAYIDELLKIAGLCDGVRCDMAMLGLNDVFAQTWKDIFAARKKPQTEFWSDAITAVKAKFPDFIFIAEVYWDLDRRLRELGFDYTYDKILYDRLRYDDANSVRQYVIYGPGDLKNKVHFIENHDEERAVTVFGKERSLAAAVTSATIPGMRFFHNGQFEGYSKHIPVQMGREPGQPLDPVISGYYDRLLKSCSAPVFSNGFWRPLEVRPVSEDNETNYNLLCWCWNYESQLKLVVINYSEFKSWGRIYPPLSLEMKETVVSYDELADATYRSSVSEVCGAGLYIELKPWQSHILDISLE